MPIYLIAAKAQFEYEALKTDKLFTWSFPSTNKLTTGTLWLIINQSKREMFLAQVESIKDSIVKSVILEELKLSKDFLLPPQLGVSIINLAQQNKTKIIETRNILKRELVKVKSSKLKKWLEQVEEEEVEDCIAYRRNNTWGFLFYKKAKTGAYTFNFVPVDNSSLNPTDEGYKDFVYFIASHGYPKAIKIGRSDNPTKRLRGLHGANPADISLLVVLPDGRTEKLFHHMFAKYKMHGKLEWFWDNDVLRKFIKEKEDNHKMIVKNYLADPNPPSTRKSKLKAENSLK